MKITTFVVDAFTDVAFKGNPAGVCLLEQPASDALMQSIAAELKHSETAFIQLSSKGPLSIRYFTPTVEIAFYGHATLGAAKVMLERFEKSEVHFITGKQLHLSAKKDKTDVVMQFPLYKAQPCQLKQDVQKALGLVQVTDAAYSPELQMAMLRVSSKEALMELRPDYDLLVQSEPDIKGLIVTASGDVHYDFYSRCFCPWIGIDEDPVTGAAHSMSADYWSKQLGKTEMTACQCSSRGGYLKLTVKDQALEVRSNAVIVLQGEMHVSN